MTNHIVSAHVDIILTVSPKRQERENKNNNSEIKS